MMDDKSQLTWEEVSEEDDGDPGYENFSRIDFNLWTDDPSVLRASEDLVSGLKGHKTLNRTCMMVLLLNLYRCWLMDETKWLAYMRGKDRYCLCRKYNKNDISWTGLTRSVDHLISLDHIEHKIGFYFRGVVVEKGKCSRARLRGSFADLLESEYGFTDSVIRRHPQEEVVILKDTDKIPIDYKDTNHNDADGKRKFLKRYNELLEGTYIDLDAGDYKAKESMWVDLSRKHCYRVFNNGKKTLIHGGRFYGGWWQGIPSELRLKIIINNMKVVECDYSGIHINLLYAKEGIDFNCLGKDAYQLPEYDITREYRNFFKVLLLAALNAKNDGLAKKAINRKFNKTPYKFPSEKPNLDEAIKHFKNYHSPIAHHFFKGVGHALMNTDAKIAEYVLRKMTEQDIPVLSVHDSFICPKIHEDSLISSMREAFSRHCGFSLERAIRFYRESESPIKRARPSRVPRVNITYEEHSTNEALGVYSDDFMVDLTSINDSRLVNRIMNYDHNGEIAKYVSIPIEKEPEVPSMRIVPRRELIVH
ncbi:hypothetical protein [Syntrophotalea acetylenica]|nr:hypothetical protein [Syntrophotalea acetylenica]